MTVSENFTVTGWAYINALGENEGIVVKKTSNISTNPGYDLQINTGGKLLLYVSDGTNQVYMPAATNFTTGRWEHFAAVFDRSGLADVKIYINGVYGVGTGTGDPTTLGAINGPNLRFGCLSNQTFCLNGAVDNVRIYKYALTADQVTQDMNAGHPLGGSPVGSQIGYWKFDEGYGDTANDSGTEGNNGDLAGSGTTCPQSGDSACPSWYNGGKYGKALDFEVADTTDDYVDFGDIFDFDATTSFTYTTWFSAETIDGTGRRILSKRNGTDQTVTGWDLIVGGASNVVSAELSDGSTEVALAGNTILTTDTWIYAGVVVDQSVNTAYLYVNGHLEDSQSISSLGTFASSNVFSVGRPSGVNSSYFDGQIDEIKVYASALSSSDIQMDYNRGKAAAFGSLSTSSSGIPSDSASRSYCVPGDSGSCGSPVGEWLMDEKTGTGADAVKDTSANANHGDMEASMSLSNWTRGKKGSGISLDGSDDTINFGDLTYLNSAADFTIEGWFKPNRIADTDILFSKQIDENNEIELQFSFNRLYVEVSSGSNAYGYWSLNSEIANNRWFHAAVVYDGTGSTNADKVKLYINGTYRPFNVINVNFPATGPNLSGTNFEVSTSLDTSDEFSGTVDELRIYDYDRTPAQIAWSYNQGAPIIWWKLDDCTGLSANDSSDLSRAATIVIGGTGSNTASGSCTSGTSTHAWYNGAAGKFGASLDLDGTDDYLTYTAFTGLVASSPFTIMGWIKTSASGATSPEIFAINTSTYGNRLLYYMDAQGQINIVDNIDTVDGTRVVNDGIWHHVALVVDDPNNLKHSYIDAVADIAGDGYSDSVLSTDVFSVGQEYDAGPTASNFWDGQIDEIKVFPYALTIQQIRQEFQSGSVSFR